MKKRPLNFNMNRLAQFSNIPPGIFAKQRFTNAADYFEELAKQQLYHLEHQRNDAVTDEADCRKKYIARCLFRKISREVSKEHCNGPFRLFCDDLRPDNVLVDTSRSMGCPTGLCRPGHVLGGIMLVHMEVSGLSDDILCARPRFLKVSFPHVNDHRMCKSVACPTRFYMRDHNF